MFEHTNTQLAEKLIMQLSLLKGEDGLLLAISSDFILAVRPGLDRDEREDTADRLLDAAESLSLPVREEHGKESESGRENRNGLSIPPDLLELAGFSDLDDLTYTVENGRIIIEKEDY